MVAIDTDIDVFIKNGEVFQVNVKGSPVRARVVDYDVVFPVAAHNLQQDEDGDYYTETIV